MTDAPVSGQTEGTQQFDVRYHGAMPGWVRVVGLSIKIIDECEGGGFAVREDHWRAIAGHMQQSLQTITDLQSEVSRLSVENERREVELLRKIEALVLEREELRAMVETLRGALTNILAACADTESSYADTVERVGRIADYEINHRTAALNKADAEVRE